MKFDKFMDDLEAREKASRKKVSEASINEEKLKRKRAEMYQEKWQNRIRWSK